MARSSRGEDARFSFWKQGFDSPTGYFSHLGNNMGIYFMKIIKRAFRNLKAFFIIYFLNKSR
jgi:hypothetical protein